MKKCLQDINNIFKNNELGQFFVPLTGRYKIGEILSKDALELSGVLIYSNVARSERNSALAMYSMMNEVRHVLKNLSHNLGDLNNRKVSFVTNSNGDILFDRPESMHYFFTIKVDAVHE